MWFRWWSGENLSQGLAGGPTQVRSDWFADGGSDDVMQQLEELSSPFALIAPVQVEGTDFPIYTRQRIDDPEEHWFALVDTWDTILPQPSVGDWPLTLVSLAADETPLNFSWRMASNQDEVMLDHELQGLGDPQWWQVFNQDSNPAFLGGTVYSDTLCRLMSEIQRHLLEVTIDEGLTWALWTRDEVLQSIYQRLHRFMMQTGLIRKRISIDVLAGQSEVELPDNVMQIRRALWRNAFAIRQPLAKIEPWTLDNSDQSWESGTGLPIYYIEQPMPSGFVQVVPTPSTAGILDLVVIERPGQIEGCEPMPIPAAFVPYIKYGVLADLLSKEGEANDPERAAHFEQRWQEGIDLGRALLGTEL